MKGKNRLLRLSLIVCLVLGWAAYLPAASPHIALAQTPLPPVEEIERAMLEASSASSPKPPQEEVELYAALEALELAHQQGPEAVLALRNTLRGKALDLAMDDIVAAHRQLAQRAAPRPEAPPVSEAEELAMLQAQAALDEASRARALAHLAKPLENQSPDAAPLATTAPNAPAADRTVGSAPCTYATIAAAMMAANDGDRLLLEGGVSFPGSLSVRKSVTLQGGYAGCGSGSSDLTTIDAGGAGRGMYIYDNLTVTLENLNVINANTAAYGAGIFVYTNTHLIGTNLNIYSNTTTALGGGIFLWGARATFTETEIYNNAAAVGAGVYGVLRGSYAPALHLLSFADVSNNNALTSDGFGGGVYMNQGVINITNSSDIYANNAIEGGGAYLISSTLTIEGEYSEIMFNTATGNGGGIRALGSTINLDRDAELYSNTAGTGGTGNGGGAYLDNSTLLSDKGLIHHNTANGYGGGIYAINGSLFDMDLGGYACTGPRCSQLSYNTAGSYGGGAYVSESEIDLRQIFVENNTGSLGGAIYAWRDPSAATRAVYVYNCLFAGNDGGSADGIRLIANSGQTTRMLGSHNTLAYNPAAGDGIAIAMGGIGSLDLTLSNSIVWGHATSINDLAQTVTCSDIEGGYAGADNLNVAPLFVSPGDGNFHLQGTSPMIDRCASGELRDFDNEPRPVVYIRPATPYDMGADEASPRVGLNGAPCAYGSIQDAVDAAASGDTIQAAADTFLETVIVNGKALAIVGGYDVDCTTYITGTTTVDANGAGAVFEITDAAVTLRNLGITGGDASNGGGVRTLDNSRVTVDNTAVYGNQANNGGGVYISSSGVLTLTNRSVIHHNIAYANGGGARVWGTLVIASWIGGITENTAPNGGGVSVPGGVLDMRPGHVGYNQATAADGRGGGIHVLDGGVVTATLSSNVYRNSAYDGGGIYADNARVTLGAVIHSNTAANNGGGIYLTNGSTLDGANTRIGDDGVAGRHNTATAGAGGGIYAQDSRVEFNGRVFGNRAATQGGGIFAASSTITLTDAHVGGTGENQANDVTGGIFGAGLYFSDTHALLSNTVVASNTFSSGAGWGGGIVAWEGSVVTLTEDSRIEHHYAPNVWMFGGAGAGLLVYSSTVTLDNSQVLSNTADIGGAGIYMVLTSTLDILNGSVIANNHVITGSGGGIGAVGAPDVNIADTTMRDNSASADGGAIYIDAGTLDFTGGWTLRENTAGGNGGAIAVIGDAVAEFRAGGYSLVEANRALGGHGGMVYLGNNTTTRLHATAGHEMYIYDNHASENGGALYADNGGYFDIYGQINFERNQAANGGAIYLTGGARVWVDDYANIRPQLWDNQADSGSGGAIYAQDSPRVRCDGATFGQTGEGNQATESGGAIYLSGSTFSADNCIFQDNQAQQHGGAIAAYTSTLSIYATYPALSLAAQPAGIERALLSPAAPAATACNPLTEQCSAFFGNVADSDVNNTGLGGAIYSNNSTLQINHTYLHRNSAYYGGAIHQSGANAVGEVANSLIYSNTVSYALGAGIRRSDGAFTVTHVTLANNIGGAGFSGNVNAATNTIAWGNAAAGFTVAPALAMCNIDQSNNAGENVDPQFVSPGAGENYRLRGSSPAIDACTEGLSPDLVNTARPFGSGYEMGAYEYGLDVAFAPDRVGSGASPDVVVYTHTLTNTGSAVDTYTLSAHSSNGWSATLDPATPLMLHGGESFTVTVNLHIPSGVVSGTVDTLVITATSSADPDLTARVTDTTTIIFPLRSLTVATVGNGTVTRAPDQPTYLHGSVVTLTATPQAGWHFGQWSGDASGVQPTTVITMTADKVITATFLATPPTYYNLTVATSGTGSGSVSPAAGVHSYLAGTPVVLQATANPGSEFVGWSGDASGTTVTTTVMMDGNKTAVAIFNQEGVCVDVTGVTLAVLTTGDIYTDTVVQFRADIVPATAIPYTYTMDFGAGPSAPGSTVHNPLFFSHTFPATGTHTVTFAAWSCAMAVPIDDTVEVTVVPYPVDYVIYLPLVLRGYTN